MEYQVIISVESNDLNDKRMPLDRKVVVTAGKVDINAIVESMIDTFEDSSK